MPGLYFDELTVGQTFKHPISRTVTEADNVFFTALTHNPALLHLDEAYCRDHTEFGQRIVNSAFMDGFHAAMFLSVAVCALALAAGFAIKGAVSAETPPHPAPATHAHVEPSTAPQLS